MWWFVIFYDLFLYIWSSLCVCLSHQTVSVRVFMSLSVNLCACFAYLRHCKCVNLHYTLLYCTVLYCSAVHYTVLYCSALYCTALHWTAMRCIILLFYTVNHCVLHYTALQYTPLHCNSTPYYTSLHCNSTPYHTIPHCALNRNKRARRQRLCLLCIQLKNV